MSDDWLWDRKGKPDPEEERLARVLGKLKYVEKPLPDAASEPQASPPAAPVIPIASARRRGFGRFAILLAAAIGAIGAAVWLGSPKPAPPPEAQRIAPILASSLPAAPEPPAMAVKRLAGAPSVRSAPMAEGARLGVGDWLETDEGSRATISIAAIGEVEVQGNSRVRLIATGPDQHRLDLERGRLSARVNAPPRLFVVGTPAATAVDLGCAYTLEVAPDGRGALHVTSGWVSLEDRARASLVPAGASCRTRPGAGPGTPWFDDAPAALAAALERFDFEDGGAAAIDVVLGRARRRDAITLWHLLARVEGGLRKRVYARLSAIAPPPREVGEAEVLRLDAPALDRWKSDFVATW
jgi:FecR protein